MPSRKTFSMLVCEGGIHWGLITLDKSGAVVRRYCEMRELEVAETQPTLRGATATASYKPAKLETGVTIQVPPFIQIGDRIRVSPSEGKYLERVR